MASAEAMSRGSEAGADLRLVDEGRTELGTMREVPPYPTGRFAEAFLRPKAASAG